MINSNELGGVCNREAAILNDSRRDESPATSSLAVMSSAIGSEASWLTAWLHLEKWKCRSMHTRVDALWLPYVPHANISELKVQPYYSV